MMSITIILILITAAISIMAFSQRSLTDKLQFNASKVIHNNEFHRLITHAFIHANWEHLIVNMIVLYSFGSAVEQYFDYSFGGKATSYYLLLYFGGTLFSNLYALFRYKNDYFYNAVGASGAVSSVLFTAIFFDPWNPVYFFGLIRFPGIIFALLYLAYSYYMSRKQTDNVAHDAHFLGALFGFIFPLLIDHSLMTHFLDKLLMLT